MERPVLELTSSGLYCSAGNFYVDPWGSVDRALITHAHADHSRSGMRSYLAHRFSVPVMKLRLGHDIDAQSIEYGESLTIGEAEVSFHPAGHIPGSAQIRVRVGGEVWVVSGDYKLEDDGLSAPFEPVRCDTFISESTFGLPIFRWEPQSTIFARMNSWWASNAAAGVMSVVVGYSLGKAQRILEHLDRSIGPIYAHGAVAATTEALKCGGVPVRSVPRISRDIPRSELRTALLIIPPSAAAGRWLDRFAPYALGYASGWMAVRGMRRRRGIEHGFVLSDHVDWPALLTAVHESGASRVLLTHGYTAQGVRYFRDQGLQAEELHTAFDGEEPAASEEPEDGETPASVEEPS